VIELLGANYGPLPDGTAPTVQPYIDTASAVVDDVTANASRKGVILSTARQELVERWMACYYYCKMDPLYKSRSTLSASGSFNEREYKEGAIDLDPSGCLNSLLSPKKRAGIQWLGVTEGESQSYEERNG
jgi:hypothetical protein